MKGYGQFCSIARALDLLGERWTLLVVRELLCGSRRFGDIRRGIPRVSRTMLSARLRELVDAGVIARRHRGHRGHRAEPPSYELTAAGEELAGVVQGLGAWGQRWLPRELPREDLDADVLLWDMRRRVNLGALPATPVVARIELSDVGGRAGARYLLLRKTEVSLCSANPGFPDELRVRARLRTMTAWWRGDISLADARSAGMTIEGRKEWVRAFPTWFARYAFAEVTPTALFPSSSS
jgi:DNA-binding HxlR family transcriptional regulator